MMKEMISRAMVKERLETLEPIVNFLVDNRHEHGQAHSDIVYKLAGWYGEFQGELTLRSKKDL